VKASISAAEGFKVLEEGDELRSLASDSIKVSSLDDQRIK
jgi:hypothetical protein